MSETTVPAAFPLPAASPAPKLPSPRPRRWAWWLLGVGVLLLVLTLVAQRLLDPWLRRKLEQQVTTQTHGQYHLRVGALHSSLWQRAVRLSALRLRPAATVADTLPRVRLDVAQLDVTGIGLLALLRKSVLPIDSVVLDSARIEVLALAQKPPRNEGINTTVMQGAAKHLYRTSQFNRNGLVVAVKKLRLALQSGREKRSKYEPDPAHSSVSHFPVPFSGCAIR